MHASRSSCRRAPIRSKPGAHMLIADGQWREAAPDLLCSFYLFDDDTLEGARLAWKLLSGREGVERRYWAREGGKWLKAAERPPPGGHHQPSTGANRRPPVMAVNAAPFRLSNRMPPAATSPARSPRCWEEAGLRVVASSASTDPRACSRASMLVTRSGRFTTTCVRSSTSCGRRSWCRSSKARTRSPVPPSDGRDNPAQADERTIRKPGGVDRGQFGPRLG